MNTKTERIKVLCVTSTYKLSQNDNVAYFISGLNNILQKKGIDVTVLAPHGAGLNKYDIFDEVKIVRYSYFFPTKFQKLAYHYGILSNIKKSFLALCQLPFLIFFLSIHIIKFLKQNNFSIIHAHWFIPQGCVAIILGKIFKKPTIVTIHGSDIRKTPRFFSKIFLKKCDKVISPHPEISMILKSLSINYIEIPNIVRSPALIENSSDVFNQFGLKQQPVISFIARLNSFKDPITLIKSVPLVLTKNTSVQFVFAGDGPLLSDILNLIENNPNNNAIKILGMIDNPLQLLSITSIFVALSRIENIWSTSLVEAMKSEVPCIVTKSGTTESHLTHMKNAYLIDLNNHEELADAIVFLLDNPNIMRQIGVGGKNLITKTFLTEEEITERVIKIYKELLKFYN